MSLLRNLARSGIPGPEPSTTDRLENNGRAAVDDDLARLRDKFADLDWDG